MNRLAVFLLLTAPIVSFAQAPQKRIHITFHVTSVRYEEDSTVCDTDVCIATKFTIEGYADSAHTDNRIAYVLTCDEYLASKPTAHITISCGSVHANNDYDVTVFGSSISFWPEEKYTPPPMRETYRIVSEKEVSKPRK